MERKGSFVLFGEKVILVTLCGDLSANKSWEIAVVLLILRQNTKAMKRAETKMVAAIRMRFCISHKGITEIVEGGLGFE